MLFRHRLACLVTSNKFLSENCNRGIERSLRTFGSMRAVRLFLRARAVINFVTQAASTLEITNGKQRALRKYFASWNLSLY